MSALCGLWHLDDRPVDKNDLNRMIQALSHRGVDGGGTWHKGPVGMGHQMFCITPESLSEKLPFHDSLSDLTITADARIDNRDELFGLLSISADEQAGMQDSLLILKSYVKWGKSCACRLVGDFAFAIWDRKNREMICATDPMGTRALYYFYSPRKFAFATEIKGIHAIPSISRIVNKKKIAYLPFFVALLAENESTFFDQIFRIPGATVMTINQKGVAKRTYWAPDISRTIRLKDENEYVDAFQEIFFKAIRARLRSAFPVVSLLSGGLDSSAVTAGAAKILGTQGGSLTALSAVLPPGYRGKAKDEKYYIDLLQGRDGLNIQYITDVWRGPFDDVERLVRGGDRPVFTSRHFLYSAFADKASEFNARVVLDGLCGELGPSHYGRGYYAELLRKGYWATLLREITALSRIENRKMSGIVRSEVLRPLAPKILMRFFGSRFDVGQIRKWTPIKRSFLDAQLGNEVSMYLNESIATFHHCSDHRKNHLEVVRRFSERGRLVDGFAGYEQIEMSYPFLDKRVLEFCLSLPGHMKVRNGYRRYMIRAGMKHVLSDELRFRVSKMPFSPDFHERYNRQRLQALHVINNIRRNELIDEIVDIEKLKTMLQYDMKDSRSNTPEAFAAMHAVPWGFFLLHFLDNV